MQPHPAELGRPFLFGGLSGTSYQGTERRLISGHYTNKEEREAAMSWRQELAETLYTGTHFALLRRSKRSDEHEMMQHGKFRGLIVGRLFLAFLRE